MAEPCRVLATPPTYNRDTVGGNLGDTVEDSYAPISEGAGADSLSHQAEPDAVPATPPTYNHDPVGGNLNNTVEDSYMLTAEELDYDSWARCIPEDTSVADIEYSVNQSDESKPETMPTSTTTTTATISDFQVQTVDDIPNSTPITRTAVISRLHQLHPKGRNTCANCSTKKSSDWRRDSAGLQLCNACYKYLVRTKVDRPRSLWEKRSRRIECTPVTSSLACDSSHEDSSVEPSLRTPSPSPPKLETMIHVFDSRPTKSSAPLRTRLCTNCETTKSSIWRWNSNDRPYCNACSQYLNRWGVERPKSLWRHPGPQRQAKNTEIVPSKAHDPPHIEAQAGPCIVTSNEPSTVSIHETVPSPPVTTEQDPIIIDDMPEEVSSATDINISFLR